MNFLKTNLNLLIRDLFEFIIENSFKELNKTKNFSMCKISIFSENKTFDHFKYNYDSGLLFSDYGDEISCNMNNQSYLLITTNFSYYLNNYNQDNPPKLNFIENREKKELMKFLKITNSIISLCIFPECEDVIKNVFDNNLNPNFTELILNITGINFNFTNLNGKKNNYYSPDLKVFIFIVLISFYILFRLFVIIYFIVNKKINDELDLLEKDEYSFYDAKDKVISKKIEFFKYFSFKYQLRIIFNDEIYYYNDKKLIFFCLLKVIIMNFFNFYNSFLCFHLNPKFNEDQYYLLKFYSFNIIKLSYFISNLIYFINGFNFSFKLLGLIFKQKSINVKEFIYFYLHILIKIFNNFLIFYLLYQFQDTIIYLFSEKPILSKAILSRLYNSEESKLIKNNGILNRLFIPFYYIFYNLTKTHGEYLQPYLRIISFLFNDFYCFTISTIIFYLLFYFKNKIIDILFTIFVLILNFKIYFDYIKFKNVNSEGFGFYKIIYNIDSIVKIDHSFICYFFGNLIGIGFFFHVMDSKNNDILKTRLNNYLPFYFLIGLSREINNFFTKGKIFFMKIIFTIILLLMISMTFNYSFYDEKLFWDYNFYSRFSISNELLLFNFLFSCLIFSAMFIFKLTELGGKKIIYFISRNFSTFIFISIIGNHFIMAFSQIDMDSYLSNILFYNWVTFLLIFFISLVFNLLFEIPLRILFKNKIRKIFGYNNLNNL